MATDVTIKNAPTSNGGKYIIVDQGVIKLSAEEVITFTNTLSTPVKAAQIRFFEQGVDKTDNSNAIAGFCDEMGTGSSANMLEVPQQTMSGGTETPGTRDCTVNKDVQDALYLYTVSADNPYETLDPVIIIEGGDMQFSALAFLLGAGAIGAGLLLRRFFYNKGHADGLAEAAKKTPEQGTDES